MKNRILSLLLSMTCLFSLFTSASAIDTPSFTDAKNIQQQEAVTTLSILGVITSMSDGSFSPTLPITRAEAARLLYVLAHGGQDSEYAPVSLANFSDTADHWAEKYITWCDKGGIISGRGNGMFYPDENITSLEFSKMILVLLGYDANAYQLNGYKWAEKTYEISANIRLYDSLPQEALPLLDNNNSHIATPLSRENAAQLLYNALEAPIVVFLAIWGQDVDGQFVNPIDENGVITLFHAAFPFSRGKELSEFTAMLK